MGPMAQRGCGTQEALQEIILKKKQHEHEPAVLVVNHSETPTDLGVFDALTCMAGPLFMSRTDSSAIHSGFLETQVGENHPHRTTG